MRETISFLLFTVLSIAPSSYCQNQGNIITGTRLLDTHIKSCLGPIPGLAGDDYPAYSFPPPTSFQCSGLVGGYYADQEADCQAYHICGEGGRLLTSRLCPVGTLYNQQYFICDWWFNVDCSVVS